MEIAIGKEPDTLEVPQEDVDAVRRAVLTVGRLYGALDAEVSVTLTNDAHIHALNRDYRGVDRPTDVLSFALTESEEPEIFDAPGGVVLGDPGECALALALVEPGGHGRQVGLSGVVIGSRDGHGSILVQTDIFGRECFHDRPENQ